VKQQSIVRDISWLAFNARVLQEARDEEVHLYDRLRFLGIFSNNLDEFYRVRVATLFKMLRTDIGQKIHLENNPRKILNNIHEMVLEQQHTFDKTFADIIKLLEQRHHVHLRTERQLTAAQKQFVQEFFEQQVRTQIVPLMIESMPQAPMLRDRSIYLACVLGNNNNPMLQRYALIEVPERVLPRFVILPSEAGRKDIILLEDIIRFNLKNLFAPFGFNRFSSHIVKLTRDAELETDNDIQLNVIAMLEKSLKQRSKGKATRFVYDRTIDPALLEYLSKRLNLSKKDSLIPGGRIHNFKDFMNFPKSVFEDLTPRPRPFVHPLLIQPCRIMEVMDRGDIMLHFPYHSFDSVIDLLREAAIDPFVQSIHLTAYRLAKDSKIINALVNAVRNGKQVTVVIELRARFDEEANLHWKSVLEEAGVKVCLGIPNMKIHAKMCVIRKREFGKTKWYGFIATGNMNEQTAQIYADHMLLTTDKVLLADAMKIFTVLELPEPKAAQISNLKKLICAPNGMRDFFDEQIQKEIKAARKKKKAAITLKLNSLVDPQLKERLYEAARAGVDIHMVIRGICTIRPEQKGFKKSIHAISIVDQYLEHARVMVFHNGGKQQVFISSADWMIRNLDHRIEAACRIESPIIQQELIDILDIQLRENVKARILDNEQQNAYVATAAGEPQHRAQVEIYHYLQSKKYTH
jgi:polyphosphate kinase